MGALDQRERLQAPPSAVSVFGASGERIPLFLRAAQTAQAREKEARIANHEAVMENLAKENLKERLKVDANRDLEKLNANLQRQAIETDREAFNNGLLILLQTMNPNSRELHQAVLLLALEHRVGADTPIGRQQVAFHTEQLKHADEHEIKVALAELGALDSLNPAAKAALGTFPERHVRAIHDPAVAAFYKQKHGEITAAPPTGYATVDEARTAAGATGTVHQLQNGRFYIGQPGEKTTDKSGSQGTITERPGKDGKPVVSISRPYTPELAAEIKTAGERNALLEKHNKLEKSLNDKAGKIAPTKAEIDAINPLKKQLGYRQMGYDGSVQPEEPSTIMPASAPISAADSPQEPTMEPAARADDAPSNASASISPTATPASAADTPIDYTPKDQAAFDWINANPDDPRAAKMKAHYGFQ